MALEVSRSLPASRKCLDSGCANHKNNSTPLSRKALGGLDDNTATHPRDHNINAEDQQLSKLPTSSAMTKKQEIIFRFTIPRVDHTESNFFTVSAFGQDYQVQYPSGIVGVRRPCSYKLGYIVLPTYYDAPKVEQAPSTSNDPKEHRYRVQVPLEVGPGEEFFVTLPDSRRQARLIAPLNYNASTLCTKGYHASAKKTVLEFQAPDEDDEPREQLLGYECHWKLLNPPSKTLQVTIPPSSPEVAREFPLLLTRIGTLPAVLTRPPLPSEDDENNTISQSTLRPQESPTTVTFAVPLAHIPTHRKLLIRNMQDEGWHRLYHVTDQRLKWVYLVPGCALGGGDESSMAIVSIPPVAFCCCYGEEFTTAHICNGSTTSRATTLRWAPAMQAPGLGTTVTSMDRKTLHGTLQTIGTYWELIGCISEQGRSERLSKWRLKLQGEGGPGFSFHIPKRAATTGQKVTSEKTNILLERLLEEIQDKLISSPRVLRKGWEIEAWPSSLGVSQDWMIELTAQLLEKELRRTTGNASRWEFHAGSRLDCCQLLGFLIGKAIIDTKRSIFSRQHNYNLAGYLYKHILQWPVQKEDLIQVDGAFAGNGYSVKAALRERLFDAIKSQIAAMLDGIFTIVPRSFMLLFRSVEELEECLAGKV